MSELNSKKSSWFSNGSNDSKRNQLNFCYWFYLTINNQHCTHHKATEKNPVARRIRIGKSQPHCRTKNGKLFYTAACSFAKCMTFDGCMQNKRWMDESTRKKNVCPWTDSVNKKYYLSVCTRMQIFQNTSAICLP